MDFCVYCKAELEDPKLLLLDAKSSTRRAFCTYLDLARWAFSLPFQTVRDPDSWMPKGGLSTYQQRLANMTPGERDAYKRGKAEAQARQRAKAKNVSD